MKHSLAVMLALVGFLPDIGFSNEPSVTVLAKDSAGNRVLEFEAMIANGSRRNCQWYKSQNGRVVIKHYDLRNLNSPSTSFIGSGEVFIRSTEFATASRRFRLEGDSTEVTMSLERGKVVSLRFEGSSGREVPSDLHPILLPHQYRDAGLMRWQQEDGSQFRDPDSENWYGVTQVEAGRYQLRVSEDTPELFLNIDDHDFLRAYEVGPFDLKNQKADNCVFRLPKPSKVVARFVVPPETISGATQINSLSYSAYRMRDPGSNAGIFVYLGKPESLDAELAIPNIAPGHLTLTVQTQSKKKIAYGEIDPGSFRDRRILELSPDQDTDVTFEYKEFSQQPYRGEIDVRVRVLDAQGKRINAQSYSVTYMDKNFGTFEVANGAIENGIIELSDLLSTEEMEFPERYSLSVRGRRIGQFSVADQQDPEAIQFVAAPDIGDSAPNLILEDLKTGEQLAIEFKGKLTFLEFWATWCGPCQQPMEKLSQLCRRNDWGNNVQVIGISIDAERDLVENHLSSRNWEGVPVYLDQPLEESRSKASFPSQAAADYMVSGVPTAFLIDDEGHIIYRGHPKDIDLAAEVKRNQNAEAPIPTSNK